jgi:hypothetical protein
MRSCLQAMREAESVRSLDPRGGHFRHGSLGRHDKEGSFFVAHPFHEQPAEGMNHSRSQIQKSIAVVLHDILLGNLPSPDCYQPRHGIEEGGPKNDHRDEAAATHEIDSMVHRSDPLRMANSDHLSRAWAGRLTSVVRRHPHGKKGGYVSTMNLSRVYHLGHDDSTPLVLPKMWLC